MFIPNDGVTEIVAHFIGHFEVRAEDLRYRSHYDEFWKAQGSPPEDGAIDPRPVGFRETLAVKGFAPEVAYVPPGFAGAAQPLVHPVHFQQMPLFVPQGPGAAVVPPDAAGAAASGGRAVAWQGDEPGSTVLMVSQIRHLVDDDVVVVGSREFEAQPRSESHAELDALAGRGLQMSSSLADLAGLQQIDLMLDLVENASAMAGTLSQDDFGPADSLFLKAGARIDGRYADGQPVDEDAADALPGLEALLEELLGTADDEPAWQEAGTDSVTLDASAMPTTMAVSSGGNLSWNEAAIVNAGLAPAMVAVAGDYHRIDAIYQTNVLRDVDAVDARWPGESVAMGGNTVHSSAQFIGHDLQEKTGAPPPEDGFPVHWAVTEIAGDLTFLSWVHQFSFVSDHDTQVLTAMGTSTVISSGLNIGVNLMGFADLGQYFDMVIVGGSLYDGNFIVQTNVLLDSDALVVWGDSSAAHGRAETGGNVLWNEATIENVGPDEWTVGLPDHYREAVDRLAEGDRGMPAGFRTDAALDGLGNLKVLYVTGNVYDIHSIVQTNIVGDADILALYEENLLKMQDSVWQVATGQNTLVNKAKILDYDSVGNTAYVGGELYSDALLVQAEIVEGPAGSVYMRGGELASEVVAFLDDPANPAGNDDAMPALQPMTDIGTSYDAFQSVFA